MGLSSGNTRPLWSGAPYFAAVQIPTAAISVNSQTPGTIGTNCFVVGNVSPTDGRYIQKVRFSFTSTTGVINTVASNINIFLSTINTGTPAVTDTYLVATQQIPAFTIGAVTTAPNFFDVILNTAVPSGFYVLVAQTVACTANSAWLAELFAGNY